MTGAALPLRDPFLINCFATRCQKSPASEAPRPGRHHVGITGGIISECPGDFVGIRIRHGRGPRACSRVRTQYLIPRRMLGVHRVADSAQRRRQKPRPRPPDMPVAKTTTSIAAMA